VVKNQHSHDANDLIFVQLFNHQNVYCMGGNYFNWIFLSKTLLIKLMRSISQKKKVNAIDELNPKYCFCLPLDERIHYKLLRTIFVARISTYSNLSYSYSMCELYQFVFIESTL
jgi:hypothetical protein